MQLEWFDWEDTLHDLARIGHPTCAHWWGARMRGPAFGALCYVCDQTIVTWARNYPITHKAKVAIEDHKIFHRSETIPSRTSQH